jgi:hypothetical protein
VAKILETRIRNSSTITPSVQAQKVHKAKTTRIKGPLHKKVGYQVESIEKLQKILLKKKSLKCCDALSVPFDFEDPEALKAMEREARNLDQFVPV